MNSIDTNTTRRFAATAIVVAMAVSLAAIATLAAGTNATSSFAWLGDYITQSGEALGSE